jgi:hypothetical protein
MPSGRELARLAGLGNQLLAHRLGLVSVADQFVVKPLQMH